MRHSLFPLLIAGALGSGCSQGSSRGEPSASARATIRNGTPDAWTTVVAIHTSQCGSPQNCTGLLISPTSILTAAHCVSWSGSVGSCPNGIDPTQTSTFWIALGCLDWQSCTNWQPVVGPFSIHPNYNPMGGSGPDIAVINLAAPTTILPARLAAPARLAELHVGDPVKIYGYGLVDSGIDSYVLRSDSIPFGSILTTSTRTSVRLVESLGHGPCAGDSGGPGTLLRDGEEFSLGVLSSSNCGNTPNYEATYTSTPAYFEWIVGHASNLPAQSYLPSAQIVAAAL